MKKILFIAVAMIGMFFVTSCSSDSDGYSTNYYPKEPVNNCQTIVDLEKYNKALMEDNVQTRGFWKFLKRLTKTVSADVCGAGAALAENQSSISTISSLNTTAGIVAKIVCGINGAISASVGAWKAGGADCELIATYPSANQTLNNLINYCQQNLIVLDGPIKDASTVLPNDTIYAQINFPVGMVELKSTGVYHNKIINDSELHGRVMTTAMSRTDHLDPDGPSPVVPMLNDLITSNEYSSQFNNTWNNISNYMGTATFDYNSYLSSVYPSLSNVKDTYLLFLQALNNKLAVSSFDDLISLINSYVNIIETNNEFSYEEREQIYAGLAVAAYSYNLWQEKFNLLDGM